MLARVWFILGLGCLCSFGVGAEEIIWKGEVKSDGTPTEVISLKLKD